MAREIKFGNRMLGDGHPAYVIAEVGINHNGDLNIAKKIIDAAAHAGADAVKFQKRTPDVSTPLDQQKQIFEKFLQGNGGNTKIKGTGLGLNISKSLVERMGGTIGFISEPNKGSTFYFTFPIVKLEQE